MEEKREKTVKNTRRSAKGADSGEDTNWKSHSLACKKVIKGKKKKARIGKNFFDKREAKK